MYNELEAYLQHMYDIVIRQMIDSLFMKKTQILKKCSFLNKLQFAKNSHS